MSASPAVEIDRSQLVSSTQLAETLGVTRQALDKKAVSWACTYVPGRGRGGKVKHYEVPSLPVDIQQRLLQHRLQKLTLSDLEPFLCESGGSASELHKIPEPALERALAKAKAVRLAEAAKELNLVPHGQRQEHFQPLAGRLQPRPGGFRPELSRWVPYPGEASTAGAGF